MELNSDKPLIPVHPIPTPSLGVYSVNAHGMILHCNQVFAELLGYTKEDVQRMSLAQISHPTDLVHEMTLFSSVLRTERTAHSFDKRYVRNTGNYIWAHVIVTLTQNNLSGEKHYLCVVETIDDQKKLIEVELQREEVFPVLVNTLNEYAIFRIDKAGKIITWNPGVQWNFGYTAEEFIGKPYRMLSTAKDVKLLAETKELQLAEKGGSISTQRFCICKDGSQIHTVGAISCLRTEGSVQGFTIVLHDDTIRQHREDLLRHDAYHDALTGLPNREVFKEQLALALSVATRKKQSLAVLFIDIDEFKQVNDVHGHAIGDAVLQQTAKRLLNVTRSGDSVSRLAGDEFAVVLNNVQSKEQAVFVARKIIAAIRSGVEAEDLFLPITASIGISIFPDDESSVEGMLHKADQQMYKAKKTETGKQHIA